MKKVHTGTPFAGARHRLVIHRGAKGSAGNSRSMMYGKSFYGTKSNRAGIGIGEIQHRGFLQGLQAMAARLMLGRQS